MKKEELCPCSSGKKFGECCGPVLAGERKAATAEELMRARYCAYAVCDIDFLYKSSGPEVRAEFDEKTSREWAQSATWEGLEILGTQDGLEKDEEGFVSFVAYYSTKEQNCKHVETSYFKRIDGEWRFIDGRIESGAPYRRSEPKVGRNDPCPCGSGKKYKKCCYGKVEAQAEGGE
jgi:SEC-C motif-containing protein